MCHMLSLISLSLFGPGMVVYGGFIALLHCKQLPTAENNESRITGPDSERISCRAEGAAADSLGSSL